MYKIGELSKLCNLPVKTLRYYDSEGLLLPDKIDCFTGYRYYSAARLAECNRITALKALGFSLGEIKMHLKADSKDSILAQIEKKKRELETLLSATEAQIQKLDSIQTIIAEGEHKMYDVVIRNADTVRVAFIREIFETKADAYVKLDELLASLPKNLIGKRKLLINYETEYRSKNMDFAVCVEFLGVLPQECGAVVREITFAGEVASLICKEEELDEAYRAMAKDLNERGAQIVGAYYEFYYEDGTVELKVPVYRVPTDAVLSDDDTDIPFENDPMAIGKWKMIDIVLCEEQFRYGYEKCSHQGWLSELYFLEGGKPYWALGGWTKGYLFTVGKYRFKNSYTIKEIDGHTLMFIEMKDFLDGPEQQLAAPEIWIYEKVSSEAYDIHNIRRTDFVDYPFVCDEKLLGKWTVRDFYAWNIDEFDPKKQNHPVNDLFFLEADFHPDGTYLHKTKNGISHLTWTKGYLLNTSLQTASAYDIKTIGGVDYLICEWKTGDYQFGGSPRVYWYVFERA